MNTVLRQTVPLIFLMSTLLMFSCAKESEIDNTSIGTAGPRLVLQISVDQLRGDMPMRFYPRLPAGGFRYLIDEGMFYENAHYDHANTETAVGHATLVTGATPAVHGMVGNDWLAPESGNRVYNTEDPDHTIIGQKPKAHAGVSPRNLLVSTIGDELINSNNGLSRVFSVSGKDRGAILPGGHKGKAFWYSKRSGEFVSSTYYYAAYPEWVKNWNAEKYADDYRTRQWSLLYPDEHYELLQADDRPFEANVQGFGRTFPHSYANVGKYHNLLVGLTPAIDELSILFAQELLMQEKLGQGKNTDFLAISLSSTDYVGHLFGPASLESEDNFFRLDLQLKKLFNFIDGAVGLENTLIVLSADHGGPNAPEWARDKGKKAERIPLDYFKTQNPISRALEKEYGRGDFIASHSHPYLYLNHRAIKEAKADVADVESLIVSEAEKIPGIHLAVSRSQMVSGELEESALTQKIVNNFNAARSGSIHLVQDKYWFFHSTEEASKMGLPNLAAIHGSPWEYDTHVPVFFAGDNLSSKKISRQISPRDIAPTLSAYLNVKPPSGSSGVVLEEVLE